MHLIFDMKAYEEEKALLNNNGNNNNYSSTKAKQLKSLYKGSHHMSFSAFQTMTDEIVHQQSLRRSLGRSESSPALRAGAIEAQGRNALYGSLPFVATFGMRQKYVLNQRGMMLMMMISIVRYATQRKQDQTSSIYCINKHFRAVGFARINSS